jgi:GTP-binding protein Era
VFTDTPGFFEHAGSSLEKAITTNFKNSWQDSDLVILMIDATLKNPIASFNFLRRMKSPIVVALNKVDIASKEALLKLASDLAQFEQIKEIFMISAETGDGLDKLSAFLESQAIESPWFYPENTVSDASIEFQLSEITREKLFLHLEKELPYSVYVETESIQHFDNKVKVFQSIVVLKDSQKGIVLGRGASMLQTIKTEARRDMLKLMKKNVDLKLFVKVKEKWTEKKAHLQNAGILD